MKFTAKQEEEQDLWLEKDFFGRWIKTSYKDILQKFAFILQLSLLISDFNLYIKIWNFADHAGHIHLICLTDFRVIWADIVLYPQTPANRGN